MKRYILIAVMAAGMCGCDQQPETDISKSIYWQRCTIDGCQYICYSGNLTHKGNCTNHVTVIRSYGQIIVDGKVIIEKGEK